MRILLTNDDGYDQPGLVQLESVLSADNDLWVVAPRDHCSGASQALALYTSMELRNVAPGKWHLEGTPTDCVKVALMEIMKDDPPDLLVSGINPGANLGHNILYSGTVAAAMEGALWGVPSISVSVDVVSSHDLPHFETASHVLQRILEEDIHSAIPFGETLNVNVPALPLNEIRGWQWTRMARFASDISFRQLEPGRVYSYDRYKRLPVTDPKGTDSEAIDNGIVSLTLLTTDRTSASRPVRLPLWRG